MIAAISIGLAPPLARGWTPRHRRSATWGRGSPARAGMDPARSNGALAPARLPRSRGDGPHGAQASAFKGLAPPLARGWTIAAVGWFSPSMGSPARAGMDPFRGVSLRQTIWLPRSRGDGPRNGVPEEIPAGAPPLARGWTPRLAGTAAMALGSPARAGMDPLDHRLRVLGGWLPRSRGDGPGEDPPQVFDGAAPPLARGWTRRDQPGTAGLGQSGGSPARAGMDPRSRRPDRARAGMDPRRLFGGDRRAGLPRSRGDGPSVPSVRCPRAPPLARGWMTLPQATMRHVTQMCVTKIGDFAPESGGF